MENLMVLSGLYQAKNKAKQSQYYLAPRFSGDLNGDLKKQSQFIERSNVVILLTAMVYGDFGE